MCKKEISFFKIRNAFHFKNTFNCELFNAMGFNCELINAMGDGVTDRREKRWRLKYDQFADMNQFTGHKIILKKLINNKIN